MDQRINSYHGVFEGKAWTDRVPEAYCSLRFEFNQAGSGIDGSVIGQMHYTDGTKSSEWTSTIIGAVDDQNSISVLEIMNCPGEPLVLTTYIGSLSEGGQKLTGTWKYDVMQHRPTDDPNRYFDPPDSGQFECSRPDMAPPPL